MTGASSQSELQISFGILLEDTLHRTDRLEEALDDLWSHFSGRPDDRSYRFFIDALKLANEGARERIRELREEFAYEDSARSGNYDDLTSLASDLDEFLERYLPLLHRPRSDELEVFAMPFTRVVKRMIPNVEILFFTWSIDGYKAHAYDVGTLEAFDSGSAKNLRLTFGGDIKFVQLLHPMLREADPFHFAVFAHEIAHIALALTPHAWEYQLENANDQGASSLAENLAPDRSTLSFIDLVTSELSMPPNLNPDQKKQLSSWFVESACDVFAMRLIGPVFALAYAEVTSANRPLEPEKRMRQRDHPPPRLRFKVLAEELLEFELGEFEKVLRPKLDEYMGIHLEDDDHNNPLVVAGEPWLSAALEKLRALLRGSDGALRGEEYEPRLLKKDLPAIFELAHRKIPPAERLRVFDDASILAGFSRQGSKGDQSLPWSEPFDWRSILNGLLLWHLYHWGAPPPNLGQDLAEADKRATHRALAGRLALGGVELSEFQRRADRKRGEIQAMRPVERSTAKQ
jgi:hypothetical protein